MLGMGGREEENNQKKVGWTRLQCPCLFQIIPASHNSLGIHLAQVSPTSFLALAFTWLLHRLDLILAFIVAFQGLVLFMLLSLFQLFQKISTNLFIHISQSHCLVCYT